MTSNKCQQCGLVNFAGTAACRRCKAPIVWGAEGIAPPPEFSSEPALVQEPVYSAVGEGTPYQQPLIAEPTLIPNYGAQSGGYVSPVQDRKLRSGMATASLVLGILGLFSLGLVAVGSIIGLILGIRAVLKANRDPYLYGGKGIAIGGIVANSIGILTIIPFALIAAIAIPNLLMARMFANEASAIGHLRTLATSEEGYRQTVGDGLSYGSMEDLFDSGLIPENSESKNGYRFKIRLLDEDGDVATAGGKAVGFEAVATPEVYRSTGRRSFYTSHTFVIRVADRQGQEATQSDPDIEEYFRDHDPALQPAFPNSR